ncbi:hypothetical protein A5819_003436 [Enterococcus sp. 7E2_DIV0204]|uniref:helix-turn-helix domain-containing protein n=1 Tax=unclassified Enterococcus TaxID=2608891 RepID=UPI000A34E15E|nr:MULTISPECIES: helix-turn-helix domain-containing protein [unclassified Enterococcus]OTN86586.1 hypothetical protein A5819_003436 [Enterococcus sp. 7E2_DIV0204]OTP47625.1 hypothetical protein A5884_003380 [Enterococcus sp. 7D2_DIV0200]
MTLFDRISELAKKQHISLKDLATTIGLSESAIYQWRTSSPKAETLKKVADYFEVSTDYLLGRTERKDPLPVSPLEEDFGNSENAKTSEYFAIQRKSRELTQKDQQRLLKIMEATFDDIDNGDFEEDEDDDL